MNVTCLHMCDLYPRHFPHSRKLPQSERLLFPVNLHPVGNQYFSFYHLSQGVSILSSILNGNLYLMIKKKIFFNFYIISNLQKYSKNSTNNSQILFSHIPQVLSLYYIWFIIYSLSFSFPSPIYMGGGRYTHTHTHTHIYKRNIHIFL